MTESPCLVWLPMDHRLLDADRDALTLELVRACVKKHVPLLGLCRGFQEINVALGGTLHQQVHRVPGLADHREFACETTEQQYAPRYEWHLVNNSVLAACAGAESAWVNSLHTQGIHELAPGLRTLAVAPDGLVEAFEIADARRVHVGGVMAPRVTMRGNTVLSCHF